MSNDFVQPKFSKKVTFLKQIFLAPKMQRLNSFLKFIFLFFGKTGKKKIIFTKSILDIFIFVHFEKVDPSFVFDFFFERKILIYFRKTFYLKKIPFLSLHLSRDLFVGFHAVSKSRFFRLFFGIFCPTFL